MSWSTRCDGLCFDKYLKEKFWVKEQLSKCVVAVWIKILNKMDKIKYSEIRVNFNLKSRFLLWKNSKNRRKQRTFQSIWIHLVENCSTGRKISVRREFLIVSLRKMSIKLFYWVADEQNRKRKESEAEAVTLKTNKFARVRHYIFNTNFLSLIISQIRFLKTLMNLQQDY